MACVNNIIHERLILKWYSGDDPRYKWFIRGLDNSGNFYGEVSISTELSNTVQFDIKGTLDSKRIGKVYNLVEGMFLQQDLCSYEGNIEGLLAKGSVSEPEIIFCLTSKNDEDNNAASFLQITETIENNCKENVEKQFDEY